MLSTSPRFGWFWAAVAVLLGLLIGRMLPDGASAPQTFAPTLPSFAPIVRGVAPAVVGIRAILPHADEVRPGKAPEEPSMNGSGFVLTSAGLVVTNHHLVEDALFIAVDVPNHGQYAAKAVGVDPVTDLALLQIQSPPEDLATVELDAGDGPAQGDWVLVLGNPYQFRQSVTLGIVSFVGRHLQQNGMLVTNEYLQFSAPVNPGSSGGPVVDVSGRVVGVTTRTHLQGQGISFAVPARVVRNVVEELLRTGTVRRGFLGIEFRPTQRGGSGALVLRVHDDEPAVRAGIKAGDVIERFDGRDVTSAHDLHDWITHCEPSRLVKIDIRRGNERLTGLQAEIAEPPANRAPVDPSADQSMTTGQSGTSGDTEAKR